MKKKKFIIPNITVTDYAAEGKSLSRHEGKIIFVEGAVPGDVVDVLITQNKKDWAVGKAINIIQPSRERVNPFCTHFGVCGGCKWQMLPYSKQLLYKQKEAEENIKRISKTDGYDFLEIVGSDETVYYRNKLEFTFSNKRYLTTEEINQKKIVQQQNALGFHAPGIFDKIIDIDTCYLMDDINNTIRNTIRNFAILNNFSFYDIRQHTGWLRNIIIRNCTTGELMVNICFNYDDEIERKKLLDHLLKEVPQVTTLLYTINPKWNDTIYDLTPQVYYGRGYVIEKLEGFQFKIGPKSFFQTNTKQAEKLYNIVRNFASLTGKETIYDLYCGTGSIGIFLSAAAEKIIGVETIPEAVEDAKENATLNDIENIHFFAGDVIKICDDNFFLKNGNPDVIIVDPPRAGMHEKLVKKLLGINSPKIVYVSCNTATQARDIGLLKEKYVVEKIQPVDMFPHTHHIECVALLKLR